MKTYYDYLKEQLSNVEDGELDCVKYLPQIFRLLCYLLNEESIDKDARRKINSAIAYLANSEDVLDEDFYGVEGYMDDLYVCCVVLKGFRDKYGTLILTLWSDCEYVIDECYKRSEEFLNKKRIRENVLTFSRILES